MLSANAQMIFDVREDFEVYASSCLKIINKAGELVPLELNDAQLYIHKCLEKQLEETGKVRALILKGRQQGASTYVEARFYWRITGMLGVKAFILTHLDEATTNLFNMTKRYNDNCPPGFKPHTRFDNAKELYFDGLDCRYSVATAGSTGTGRSSTAQLFHGCLSPDSLIITPSGAIKPMQEMCVGDEIVTHTGALAPISFISQQQKPAAEVRLRGMSEPIIATGEHRFLTRDGWMPLSDLDVGDEIGYPVRRISHENTNWPFRLPHSVRPQGGGSAETGPDRIEATYELGRMLGLYLAEGCIPKQSKTGSPSAVTFAVHQREAARTEEWLDALPKCFRSRRTATRKDSLTVTVTAYGRSFATFVRSLCGETDSKRLPENWHTYGEDFARGIVHGYLSGDGHSSKRPGDRRIAAPSIRSAITIGMRDALASLGYGWAGIDYRGPAIRNGRNERAQWTLRLCGLGVDKLCEEIGWTMPERARMGRSAVTIENGFAWVPVKAIEYQGVVDVMDFEIDHEDHSYLCLQGATHNSEVGFWQGAEKHMAGIGQTVPEEIGTEIILESTANGIGNVFHQKWLDAIEGRGEYLAIFVPWFWQREYRKPAPAGCEWTAEEMEYKIAFDLDDDQMYWRRMKLIDDFRGDDTLFNQEYPATAEMAFMAGSKDSFISPMTVAIAQKRKKHDLFGATVIGVDPAEYGSDDTAIAIRKGFKLLRLIRIHGENGEQIAGRVAKLAEEYEPDAINVDVGGIGTAVELFLTQANVQNVHRINFGSKAIEPERFVNRSCEMWWNMGEWLLDERCEIIKDPRLQTDLVGRKYDYDPMRRFRLETKEKMKGRGLKSPDSADSLALTFAVSIKPKVDEYAETLVQKLARVRGYGSDGGDDGMAA